VSLQLDEHRHLLADGRRLDALSRAIAATVRPGDIVLDVASGTGVLGLLACRAGAARVYCIEQGGIIAVARELARANGVADRMHFVKAHSSWAEVPEPADVIVCDQIGHFGFEAGIVEMLADVRHRLLKPDGAIVPSTVTLSVGLVELPALRAELAGWTTPLHGFDVSPAQKIAVNSGHPVSVDQQCLLSRGEAAYRLEMKTAEDSLFSFSVTLTALRDGILDGVAGWFVAELSSGITMTNAPNSAERIDRRNAVFPIERPVAVRAGDEVVVRMRIRPGTLMVRWDVEIPASGARFSHSTLAGMLVPAEMLHRTDPRFVPHLTARGDARQTVLALCDGIRTLECIEREVHERHPALFRDFTEAQVFVAEVVTNYAE
jgi:hypothetical protein